MSSPIIVTHIDAIVYRMQDEVTGTEYMLVYPNDKVPTSVDGTSPDGAGNPVIILDISGRPVTDMLLMMNSEGKLCVGHLDASGNLSFEVVG